MKQVLVRARKETVAQIGGGGGIAVVILTALLTALYQMFGTDQMSSVFETAVQAILLFIVVAMLLFVVNVMRAPSLIQREKVDELEKKVAELSERVAHKPDLRLEIRLMVGGGSQPGFDLTAVAFLVVVKNLGARAMSIFDWRVEIEDPGEPARSYGPVFHSRPLQLSHVGGDVQVLQPEDQIFHKTMHDALEPDHAVSGWLAIELPLSEWNERKPETRFHVVAEDIQGTEIRANMTFEGGHRPSMLPGMVSKFGPKANTGGAEESAK